MVLVALVAVAGRFEDAGAPLPGSWEDRPSAAGTAVGVLVAAAGLAALVITGPADPSGPLALPVWPLAAVATGGLALGIVEFRSRAETARGAADAVHRR